MKTLAIALLAAGIALAQNASEVRVERHVIQYAPHAAAMNQTVGFIAHDLMPGGRVVKGAPYAAEAVSETVQTLADGNRITHKNTTQMYRDGEGRTRRQERLSAAGPLGGGGDAPELIMIDDPVAKTHYILDPRTKTANKALVRETEGPGVRRRMFYAAAGPVPAGPQPAEFNIQLRGPVAHAEAQSAKTESLGKRTIEGVQADGTRSTTVIPPGAIGNERPIEIVSERWYSPELQMLMMSRTSDPRLGETTYRIVNLQRAEQPRSLFEVPSDYTTKEPTGDVLMMKRRTAEPKQE